MRDILSSKRKKDSVCGLMVNGMMRTLGTRIVIVSPGYIRLTPPSKMFQKEDNLTVKTGASNLFIGNE